MAGFVTPCFEEEDLAHDEVLGIDTEQVQYIVLEDVLGFAIDWSSTESPPYIETKIAWYILKKPSAKYKPFWQHFIIPRRIAQLCISKAVQCPERSYQSFLSYFVKQADPFGRSYEENDLQYQDVVLNIYRALQDLPNSRPIRTTPFIQLILSRMAPRSQRLRTNRVAPLPTAFLSSFKNPDLALLRPENQNPTQVTLRIAKLAIGFFQETLQVLGPQPRKSQGPNPQQMREAWRRLRDLIVGAGKRGKTVDYDKKDRTTRNSDYVKAITVGNEIYRVGDSVIIPLGRDPMNRKVVPELPDPADEELRNKGIWDYFWFARIIWLNYATKEAHVQWYNHSSVTAMQGFGDKQELFLQDLCDKVGLEAITAKVTVHRSDEVAEGDQEIPFGDFFCKMRYDPETAQYTSFTVYPDTGSQPPDNCPVCSLKRKEEGRSGVKPIPDENGFPTGISVNNMKIHRHDFILYHGDEAEGPGQIGQVYDLNVPRDESDAILRVKRLGRISQIRDALPDDEFSDERHLFATSHDNDEVSVQNVIRIIYVIHTRALRDHHMNINDWTTLSPDHFYMRYQFRKLKVALWASRQDLRPQDVSRCMLCIQERLDWLESLSEYQARRRPIFALDLFGGAGALGVGMSTANKSFKVKYAIELTPSAAQTYRKNSPETSVCNQCTNIVLQYAVKKNEGHDIKVPLQLFDGKTPIPQPPEQKEVDVILAGLPCQPHSDLNMFKKADDRKSNLILNMLSYVDFYRPAHLFVENVPGFLRYNLNATQKDRYNTKGGVDQGGLQLMLRALTDMNYQLRFALLQAGHYGSPQSRIRFILVASKIGQPLPQLPQPTHDFINVSSLPIRLANDYVTRPIITTRGRALHSAVNITDAISDLPRWDWQHPKPEDLTVEQRAAYRARRDQGIKAIPCVVRYHHEPRTRYQEDARKRATLNLQHFTKCLIPPKVQRTVEMPLEKANHIRLRRGLQQYQTENPESWVGRGGYRRGLYARPDPEGYFQTTVTNVDPTAKQSCVLNPWCHRIYTIRELARTQGFPDWFVFIAIKDDVRTMHRMIGNAVPFPLSAALSRELLFADFKSWRDNEANAIVID
ncbi:S-adenosyl-L-methionine-dependent methyltransferase [Marasmius fiardii PR-910]|nr:S-adenosyl-L-methionine-dependent methyltransferase [Marasmius fiardii PR-910]